MILKESIKKLLQGENLPPLLCQQIMREIFNQDNNPIQIAALLVLLRAKRETTEELFSMISVLRNKMQHVSSPYTVLDIVGTGGDELRTINISTGSAILAASCGIRIAKHGNRSVSSLTGSADVLEALGVNIHLTPEKVSQSIEQIGIGFCYSPLFHQSYQAIASIRKQLSVPTLFNYIGPFLNPASPAHIILGVADATLLSTMAAVLGLMNTTRSIIVHSMGLDEISCVGPIKIIEINHGVTSNYLLDPKKLGLSYCKIADLRGGEAAINAQLLLDAFKGKKGPLADTLILNAAVALYIYGSFSTIEEAIPYAQDNLASGKALTLLNNWIEFSYD